MSYNWLISIVTIAAAAHYLTISRRQGTFTLDSIFVLSQWVMAVGTLVLLEPQDTRDSQYAVVVTVPMLIYIAVSICTYMITDGHSTRALVGMRRRVTAVRPKRTVVALLVLSIVIMVAYYRAVGYSVLVLGIESMLTGSKNDYTSLRLDSYGGSRYLFPGYVNQFKNVILPALVVVIIFYLWRARRPYRRAISAALTVVALYGLLGTGQRGALVLFAMTLLTFLYHANRRRFRGKAAATLVAGAPLLMVITFLLGRSSDLYSGSPGPVSAARVVGAELLKRFFYDNQWSGQMAFWYTFNSPVQNGAEWRASLVGLLPGPGQSGPNLAQQVFESLYGTPRGTAPLSMWGSVYYNFGWFGLIVVPTLLAIAYQVVTYRSVRRPVMNSLQAIGMSGVFVVFGTWIAGGPEYLFNAGGLTFGLLWWMGRRAGPHAREAYGCASPGLAVPPLTKATLGVRRKAPPREHYARQGQLD